MMDLPNIRHIRAFCEVARRHSISRSAERVHLSQPAITQAIAGLEQMVGAPLFVRRADGMFATEAGTLFLARAERLLDHLRIGAREVIRLGGRRGGRGFAEFDLLVTAAQLRALAAIADAGNFSLAARAVGRSQPSIHRAARDLERLSGVTLFNRTATGIELTPAARALVQRVKLAMAEMAQGFAEIAELRGVDSGTLVIGGMPLSRAAILPAAINALSAEFPAVRISVVEGPYDDLLHGLRQGEIDLLIGALRDPVPIDDVVQEPLFDDPLVVMARRDHPLAGRARVTLDDLAAYPWGVPRRGAPTRDRFEALFDGHPNPPFDGLVEASSLVLMRGLLLGSDRLTLISQHQIRHEQELGLLVQLAFPVADTARPIGITLRRDWRPTPTQRRFIDHIRAAGDDAADG